MSTFLTHRARANAPLLALESADSSISFLDRDGKTVSQSAIRPTEGRAALACLAWHPHSQVISVACRSGSARIAHVSPSGTAVEKALSGVLQAHPVLLAWSPTGSSLILGYKTGDLRIWRQPAHTKEDPLPWAQANPVQVAVPGVPAHLVFSSATLSPNSAINSAGNEADVVTSDAGLLSETAGHSGGHQHDDLHSSFFLAVTGETMAPQSPVPRDQGDYKTHLYRGDVSGACKHIHTLAQGGVQGLFFVACAHQLVCLGTDAALTTLAEASEQWKVLTTMRFSAQSRSRGQEQAGGGAFTLASIASGDNTLRFFNLETRGTFTVPLPVSEVTTGTNTGASLSVEASRSLSSGSRPVAAVAMAYCASDHALAVACSSGDVHLLRHLHEDSLTIAREASLLKVSRAPNCAIQSGQAAVAVFRPHALPTTKGTAVAASSAPPLASTALTEISMRGMDVCGSCLAVWGTDQIEVFEADALTRGLGAAPATAAAAGGVSGPTRVAKSCSWPLGVAVHDTALFQCTPTGIQAVSVSDGSVLASLEVPLAYGAPVALAIAGSTVVAVTSTLTVCGYTLAKRGAQLKECFCGRLSADQNDSVSSLVPPALFSGVTGAALESLQVSPDGKRLALLFSSPTKCPDAASTCSQLLPGVLVYDIDADETLLLDLRDFACAPRSLVWASSDSKILGVHVSVSTSTEVSQTVQDNRQNPANSSPTSATPALAVVFVVARRMMVYHLQPLRNGAVPLLLDPPFVSGMEDADESTRQALLSFTLHMATGDVAAATAAMLHIRGQTAWSTMARVAVRARRSDILSLCLDHLEHLPAAQSARVAKAHAERMAALERRSRPSGAATSGASGPPAKLPGALSMSLHKQSSLGTGKPSTPTTPAQSSATGDTALMHAGMGKDTKPSKGDLAALGMTAVHLGMHEEGLDILREAECWHELIEVLQAMGRWDAALAAAQAHCPLQARSVHHAAARHAEMLGKRQEAASHFVAADPASIEVPRMMLRTGDESGLERYAVGKAGQSKELDRWWGTLLASRGDLPKAMAVYDAAQDTLSQVRLLCDQEDYETAKRTALDDGNIAAIFFLARRFEALSRVPEATELYVRAKRPAFAAAYACRRGAMEEVQRLAMLCDEAGKMKYAEWLLAQNERGRAATLFQAAGAQERALRITMTDPAADDATAAAAAAALSHADSKVSSSTLLEFAQRFAERGQHVAAAHAFIGASRPVDALELVEIHDLPLDDDFADKLAPAEHSGRQGSSLDENTRREVLRRVAKVARKQGLHALAARKYTQAGDPVKAMKALLHTGEQDRIMRFATASRSPVVYLLAAQWMQASVAWMNNEAVHKQVVALYTKAKSPLHTAAFYEASAQADMDENRDYARAEGALQEALKQYMAATEAERSSKDPSQVAQEACASAQERLRLLGLFRQARDVAASAPNDCLSICQSLLAEVPPDTTEGTACVRIGDVYSLVVDTYVSQGEWDHALDLLRDMHEREIATEHFISGATLHRIYHENGLETPSASRGVAVGSNVRQGAFGTGAVEDADAEEVEVEESERHATGFNFGMHAQNQVDGDDLEDDIFGF